MQQHLKACAAQLFALAATVREQSSPAHLAHAMATGFEHVAQTIEHGLAHAEAVGEHFAHLVTGLELTGDDQAVIERAGMAVATHLGVLVGQVEPAPAAAAAASADPVPQTAPRITQADLDANIVDVEIVKHVSKSGQVLRWAVITAKNGFAVTGRPSASVCPENDDPAIGEKVAVDNARNELWPLMGYELRSKVASA